jgi:hypothetical protein
MYNSGSTTVKFRVLLVCALAVTAGTAEEKKPAGLSVSTWVREDIFAGMLVDNLEGFQTGMRKLDEILAESPDNADALAWRGGANLYLATRAHAAGDSAEFNEMYGRALRDFERAKSVAKPGSAGFLAITGGSWTVMAERLPADLRTTAYERAYANYSALREVQKAYFDKLPVHMR